MRMRLWFGDWADVADLLAKKGIGSNGREARCFGAGDRAAWLWL